MKCPVCGNSLTNWMARSLVPMWVLWTNILVLPTLGIAFGVALYETIGAWSLIIGFAGTVVGIVVLWIKTTNFGSLANS